MQKHIAAFDPLILAMVHARRGETVKAAKLFASACTAPDATLAIQTLEKNNQKAFAIEASARAKTAKQVQAKKKVVAEEFEIEGEDPVVEDEEVIEAGADEVEGDDADSDDETDGDDDEGDDTFEATLASFLKKGK